MALLSVQNLSLGYENQVIVEGLNFQVGAGDYLCIVGENGSGKSTLMKTLLHLIPPISGEIKTGDGLSRRELGYLPQQTMIQRDFPASVSEIVLSGCQGRLGKRPFYNRYYYLWMPVMVLCLVLGLILYFERMNRVNAAVFSPPR